MKILHLEYNQYPISAITSLEKIGIVNSFDCHNQQDLYQILAQDQYDIIFTRLGLLFDEKCFQMQPKLKYLVTSTTGLNHISVEFANETGVRIISLKGEQDFLMNVKSTAEHTWSLLLACIRNFRGAIDDTLEGNWNRRPFLSDELDNKTLGIIGYGRLGKIVAGYGIAFNMKVLVHDNNPESFSNDSIHVNTKLDVLLSQSDYILLMISHSQENIRFFDEYKFSLLKQNSYFINTARGELIDEKALLKALKNGKIKGAGIDVLDNDSAWSSKIEGSFDLIEYARNHKNLIITPHMGGYGKDSITKTRLFVTQKLINNINNEANNYC